MNSSRVRKSFMEGRKDREQYPLKTGLYKLIEVRRYPDGIIDTLDVLMSARHRREPLSNILFGDSPKDWALGCIKHLAFRVGKDLLPSIEALTGNGLPTEVLNKELPNLTQLESCLLYDLRGAEWQLRSMGMSYEYRRWDVGASALLDPCVKFLDITAVGLRLIDLHLPDRLTDQERKEFFQPHPKVAA